jgi:hypothetical protein
VVSIVRFIILFSFKSSMVESRDETLFNEEKSAASNRRPSVAEQEYWVQRSLKQNLLIEHVQ